MEERWCFLEDGWIQASSSRSILNSLIVFHIFLDEHWLVSKLASHSARILSHHIPGIPFPHYIRKMMSKRYLYIIYPEIAAKVLKTMCSTISCMNLILSARWVDSSLRSLSHHIPAISFPVISGRWWAKWYIYTIYPWTVQSFPFPCVSDDVEYFCGLEPVATRWINNVMWGR